MIRNFVIALLISALFTAAATTAYAKSSRGRGKYLGPSGTFTGVVTAVSEKSLTIDAGTDKPKPMTFSVTGETAVTSGRQSGVIKDVKPGHVVTVRVQLSKVQSIDVTGRR